MTEDELKADILNKEAEIQKLKKALDENKNNASDLAKIREAKEEIEQELSEIKEKYWDGKNRRAKERRNVSKSEKRESDDDGGREDDFGGPFA